MLLIISTLTPFVSQQARRNQLLGVGIVLLAALVGLSVYIVVKI